MGPYLGLLLASEFAPSRYEATFHEDRAPYGAETRIYPIAPAQAALARVGLKRLDTRNGIRRRNAEYLFGALAGLEDVLCQEVESQASHTFNAFPLRVPEAASLGRYLLHRGIDIRRDYMTWYTSPRFTDEVVYIPNHPGLSVKKMGYIARTIREFYR
jgi:dTDP-4-amino-4,6-dideoxygalactose transaminase